MECIPFVRKIALLRSGSIPESPADFNRKAFPARSRQTRRRAHSIDDSSTVSSDTVSTVTSTSTTRDILMSEAIHSRRRTESPCHPNRYSINGMQHNNNHFYTQGSDESSELDDQLSSGCGFPSAKYYDQVTESGDQSTIFSMSNEVDFVVKLEEEDFLGISIVGHNYSDGDSCLFVGAVVPGGAVAKDGRIQAGDLILAVNGKSLDGMSNKQAVAILRDAAKQSRQVTLRIVPCDNMSVYSEESCVRPIDPFLWLAHNSFVQQSDILHKQPQHAIHNKYGSCKTLSSMTSSSLSSSMPSTAVSLRSRTGQKPLPLETPTDIIANRLKAYVLSKPKINKDGHKGSPSSTIEGLELRDWLFRNVKGFKDKTEAELYATHLITTGYMVAVREMLGERVPPVFSYREIYVVQTRPMSPAIRSMSSTRHSFQLSRSATPISSEEGSETEQMKLLERRLSSMGMSEHF